VTVEVEVIESQYCNPFKLSHLGTDMKNVILQHNMDVIKVECDPDLEAHAVSLDGEDLKQDVKEEPLDVPVSISSQQIEVRSIIN
jgi:hypothetical protein